MVRWYFVAFVSLVVAGCPPMKRDKVLDHFKCYTVTGEIASPPEVMRLKDQFHVEDNVRVVKVRYFCNPVTKYVNGAERPAKPDEDHLTCYAIEPREQFQAEVQTRNQFGQGRLRTRNNELLCVPTHKLGFEPPPAGHCPGDTGCCCNMPDGQGGTWPDCKQGFECRRQVNTTDPSKAIQVCVPVGTGANVPLQLHGSQPPFCRLPDEGPHCPGKTGCCCNLPNAAGVMWPDCDVGFECRREVNPADPNRALQVCVPNGTPANAPLQLDSSQPPLCR
jgi:hypothetical protein